VRAITPSPAAIAAATSGRRRSGCGGDPAALDMEECCPADWLAETSNAVIPATA
jgi:hypothetical protein